MLLTLLAPGIGKIQADLEMLHKKYYLTPWHYTKLVQVDKDAKTTGNSFLRKTIETKIKDSATDSTSIDKTKDINLPPLINIGVISESGRSKRTNIAFTENGLNGKDEFDAYRLLPLSSSHLEFHTLLTNGTELAINNLPADFNSRLFIPLHFDAYEDGSAVSGSFKIVWGDLRGVPEDWIIHLIDNETGSEINLFKELEYEFNHSTRAKIRRNYDPLSPSYQLRAKAATMDTRFTLKVSTEQIERDVPEQIFLSQNYPNPFNPSTIIEFGLDETSNVVLEIYDILGRKIQTLINEQRFGNIQDIFHILKLL
ncbi:MAG: hypothetical protein MJK14_11720 [Rivularia sp. ALOHA_DT_140]|nr:hypothetical protein [Rivularia sp. ALOHA_DT_140]